MNAEAQAVYLNAVPLLVQGLLYLAAAAASVALPVALFFTRGRAKQAREASEREAVTAFRTELARLGDVETIARRLTETTVSVLGVEFSALVRLVGEEALGVYAQLDGQEVPWWRDLRVDLREPSAIASAAFEAAPFAVYDIESSASVNRRIAEQVGAKSGVWVPLVTGEQVTGVLAVATTHERRAFPPEDVTLLQELAAETALAVDRVHSGTALEDALEENTRRLRRQTSLVEAAQAVTAELELETVLQRLVDEVAELLGGDAAHCYLLDTRRGVFRCMAVKGLPADLVGFEFDAGTGLSARAVARGRAVIAADSASLPSQVPHAAYEGFASAIAAPIAWGEEVRGVLGVGSRQAGTFDETDADVLEAFAGLASLALRNAEAFEERSRQARIQRGFYRIATVLGQPLSIAETLDAVAQAASDALGGAFAAVLIPRSGGLELAGSQDLPPSLAEALAGGLVGTETPLAVAAEDGRILAAPDVPSDGRFDSAWHELAERVGCRSLLAVPVQTVREGEGTGLVLVFFAEERRFEDEDLELAHHLGGAAHGALERSALFEEERAARSLAQQLARTGALLATELDPASVLEEVVRQAPSLVGVEACAIRVLEGDDLVLTAVEGEEDPDEVLGARSAATVRLSGDVVQSRSPLAIEDAWTDDRLPEADPILALGYRGFLGVPLIAPEGAVHGVLAVYSRRPKQWRTDEIEALMALAANASAALSNAELYQRVALEKERSFAILANIADGIVAVDRDGKVVLWNKAAEQITGVPAEEALGHKPFEVLGRNLESEGDAPAGDRLVPILRGGDEVWLSLTEAVMRDPAGAVAGRIFAFRDISSERLVEQMKSEFVSTVSEEIRRPLTSIYGFAETLLRRDVLFGEEERRTFLGYIASESERLTTIVDALLNVARLDVGDLQMNLVPTDVGSIVSEVVGSLQASAGVNGHQFVVDLPAEPVAAEADPEKLRQVLQNLIDNAVKFSPGGGTVTVAARRHADTVEVSVADEGIGIPATERDRIFRKFYRGDVAGGREGLGGTGLGLFIAQGLVTAMGGRIWVTSREGPGSSFTFELPAASVSEVAGERVRASGGR